MTGTGFEAVEMPASETASFCTACQWGPDPARHHSAPLLLSLAPRLTLSLFLSPSASLGPPPPTPRLALSCFCTFVATL